VQSLKLIASRGTMVFCTIHQPENQDGSYSFIGCSGEYSCRIEEWPLTIGSRGSLAW
ncbi:hypothetical protein ALC56_00056, partial [Trachymyrmex septentrionalis]